MFHDCDDVGRRYLPIIHDLFRKTVSAVTKGVVQAWVCGMF